MSDYTVQLEGLELFAHLIGKGSLPHQALDTMIEHNQSLDTVRLYLKSMIKEIEKQENNNVS